MNVQEFVRNNIPLCICTLGLAIIGYLGYHAVQWIIEKFGTVQKVDDVAQKNIPNKNEPVPSNLPQNIQPVKVSLVNDDVLNKISARIHKIVLTEPLAGITYYDSQPNHVVFSFQAAPDLIFKMRKEERIHDQDCSMQDRLKNIEKARSICKTHNLGLLVVPKAEIATVEGANKKYELLVEKKLDIQQSEETYSHPLSSDHIRQLAIFILHSGFSDVAVRNMPLVKSKKAGFEKFKIGLIDLEEMNSIYLGLCGGCNKKGLTDIFPESKNIIIEEVKKVTNIVELQSSFQDTYKPDFSRYPKSQQKLIEIANALYERLIIKKKFAGVLHPGDATTLMVGMHRGIFERVDSLNDDTTMSPYAFSTDQEYYGETMIGIVTKEFIKHGLLTGVTNRNGHGWYLSHT